MASIPLDKFQILAPPVQFAEIGIFIANAMIDSLDGAWFFNKFSGETDAEAAARCSFNWAPNAPNEEVDRQYPGGIPVFQSDFATFLNLAPLQTNLPDFPASTGGCAFILARSKDMTLGAVSADRGNLCGCAHSNTQRGSGMQLAAASTGQVRCQSYAASAPTTVVTLACNAVVNTLDKWRIYYYHAGPTDLKMTNISGDGATPNPAAVPLNGGHIPGSAPWHIGGYAIGGTTVFNNNQKDIAFCLRFHKVPTTPEFDAIAAQCRDLMSETTIKELANIP